MQGILNQQQIALALTAIHTPSASPSDIKTANSFLNQCEAHPAFSTTLLSIYREAAHPQLQMSALLLLTNVVKRNWSSKRGGNTRPPWSAALKDDLRNGVLQSYFLHQLRHYKHMNSLLGYLARLDFPQQYPALHQFILNSLAQLAELARDDPVGLLSNNRVLAVLSVCKVVLKEYNHKKIAHSQEIFTNYIAAVIQAAAGLSERLFAQVRRRLQEGGEGLSALLECLRKADKVVLYCLGSMPSIYQYKPETQAIAQSYVARIQEFNSLLELVISRGGNEAVIQQLQKYLTGVVEQVGRLQNYFPFLFAGFLKEYLFLILKLLVNYLPRANFYRSAKLLSVIITTNIKPLISFAYYMTSEEFTASVYCKKKEGFDNTALQAHCHSIFKEIYTNETAAKLLQTIICEIMTAPHVLADHKEFSDQLVLQDVEIAIVQQVADPSVYDTCVNLLKQVVKCFRDETHGFVVEIIEKVQQLKNNTDRYSQQVMRNVLEMVLFLPHVYEEKALPLQQVVAVIGTVYEVSLFNHLSRLIRKYYSYLPLQTARGCFQLLAKVVASPIGGNITPQIIYQAALGLKTLLGGMQSDNIPVQVLAGCISNIVNLVGMKQVIACPTLMWPIINLIIRLVKGLYDIGREYMSGVAEIIVRGLAPLISAERNEQLLVNALVELMSTLFYCCFKGIKMNYSPRSQPVQLSERVQGIGKGAFVLFQAGVILLRLNMHNKALENNLTLQRFWLSLMRSYPTLYDQQLYGFDLGQTNNKLVDYFNKESQGVMEDEPVIFLELLEEYLITELVNISAENLLGIVSKLMAEEQDFQRRLRLTFAVNSLYHSFSLLRAPVPGIIQIIFKQLLQLQSKISPQVNSLRTAIFLMLSQRMLGQNIGEMFTFFTGVCGGEVGRWLIPLLWNMHFLTNKFAFKLNAAALLKAVTDIGAQSFAELMKIQYNQQYAIDEFLKIITIQLGPVNLDFLINSYQNLSKLLLPNEIVPDFQVPTYRKVRLQLSDPLLSNMAKLDLWGQFRVQGNALMGALDWSSADIQQRVGETAALHFCDYLGWQRKIV